jgi:hypothetical protein
MDGGREGGMDRPVAMGVVNKKQTVDSSCSFLTILLLYLASSRRHLRNKNRKSRRGGKEFAIWWIT